MASRAGRRIGAGRCRACRRRESTERRAWKRETRQVRAQRTNGEAVSGQSGRLSAVSTRGGEQGTGTGGGGPCGLWERLPDRLWRGGRRGSRDEGRCALLQAPPLEPFPSRVTRLLFTPRMWERHLAATVCGAEAGDGYREARAGARSARGRFFPVSRHPSPVHSREAGPASRRDSSASSVGAGSPSHRWGTGHGLRFTVACAP